MTKRAKRVLIVDGDEPFRFRLSRILSQRNFEVKSAGTLQDATRTIYLFSPDYILMDIKLSDGNGLEYIGKIKNIDPKINVIIATSYASIATTVEAMKAGAFDYIPKPLDEDLLVRIMMDLKPSQNIEALTPMSPDRVRWEHIQRIFSECNRNVSLTARCLKMHRRTLQRILTKRAPQA